MKKTFIIGFILLGIVARGEMGTDIKQNQIILDNIKAENTRLRDEIKRLSQILDKLEINLAREIKFEDLGIEIKRDIESFTLKIAGEDLSQGEYDKVLDNFIGVIKYDLKGPVIFAGDKENVEFLRSHFTGKGIDPARITLEIKKNDGINPDKEGIKVRETKIILKKRG
ncbi:MULTISPECIES: hypothetical protein [Psychrilyobacter]|uniref:Uncharacterized protein n=1 Tax=Psychrilyobacter piezotolerans TaxID=2293438 RepID=A0ABX9KFL9_9FUSO|nr:MULTISPECIES: hypothetical protein [Psychrilyobacter]MCS5421392.1 hypothetical protein [Psychrilyobacter sp. S5]NDI78478.1 hypothetical protein [Psychrilyobacter piezotolerans]RDE60663.1 hypothetical protein DV867_10550 [Psychrilyobacter sp. S5]REI40590.1 hypothetical protein DYH56_10550 [Psychrilyobacter piezotolerans]